MQSFSKRWILPLLALLGLLTACGQQVVTPVDTAAFALSANITIHDVTQGHTALVAVQLSEKSDNSKVLQFDSQEMLASNNTILQWNSKNKDYEANIARQPVGGTYTIVYTDHGRATTVTISVPQLPIVTSPTKDATIARSSHFTVSYQAQNASQIEIDASDGAGHYIRGGMDRNSGSKDINTNSLDEGVGIIRLVADYNTKPTSADFGSVQSTYEMIVGTTVIWA